MKINKNCERRELRGCRGCAVLHPICAPANKKLLKEYKLKKARLSMPRVRLQVWYPGQSTAQTIVADIDSIGDVIIHANAVIGNAIPICIWHGIRRRINLSITTKAEAKEWFRNNKKEITTVINGMSERWDGSNGYIGVLTDAAYDAENALQEAEYDRN